jgi:hypothetical protein
MRNMEWTPRPDDAILAICGGSSVGRASAFQADCRGFEPRPPLHGLVAQWIEHQPSKLLVTGSNPVEVTNNSKQEESAWPQAYS